MSSTPQTDDRSTRKPLRLWPGVTLAVLLVSSWFGLPIVWPDGGVFGMLGGVAAGALIGVWWVFFSRAPWLERLGAIVLMVVGVMITWRLVDRSISNAMMGRMLIIFPIPVLAIALVAWAVSTRGLSDGRRRIAMVVAIALGCSVFTLIRTGGITGEGQSDLHWRWTKTPEQRLLAQTREEPVALAPASSAAPAAAAPSTPPAEKDKTETTSTAGTPAPSGGNATPAAATASTARKAPTEVARDDAPAADSEVAANGRDWLGFRGSARNSVVRGVQIKTDWSAAPPVQMWRRAVGPGWSSFAVRGDYVYTQEQRGEDEIVSCYKLSTGEPVWRHRDHVRFYESNGGAGPRATPTLDRGRLYTFGATGILNALDARTGAVIWSHNAGTEAHVKVPGWGFASSPLVVDDVVVVAVSGAIAGYDRATGRPLWNVKSTGGSYSSPQLVTLDGVKQVLLLRAAGTTSVAPADGQVLWEYKWEGIPIIQPAVTADGDLLVTSGDAMGGFGVRRLSVTHGSNGWTTHERWMSNGLKPYFNDYVVHNGHAYGFDGGILSCIDLSDGKRKWKGGRYGHGQAVLLADQDLLLVLSEEGELALVKATPDQFTEVAKVPALDGKTWNHPVVVGDVLLVRNGEEMAAFRLSLMGS